MQLRAVRVSHLALCSDQERAVTYGNCGPLSNSSRLCICSRRDSLLKNWAARRYHFERGHLTSMPARGSLFGKGTRPLLGILGTTQSLVDGTRIAPHNSICFGQWQVFSLQKYLLVSANCKRRGCTDALSKLPGAREHLRRGGDGIYEATSERLARAHPAAGEKHLHRNNMRQAARQVKNAAGICNDTKTCFREKKFGMLRGYHEIASEHQFEATSSCEAIHGGNYWFADIKQLGEPSEAARAPITVGRLNGATLEIPACRKEALSSTSDNTDTQRRIITQFDEHCAKCSACCRINRVCARSVQYDFENRPIALGTHTRHLYFLSTLSEMQEDVLQL